ncbi:MAG: MiaB/RimO family radical SAM methylthiotransferase [Candidatus Gygaella obscura]|nr:MiaB/RimO family radical SAM methylthiotransferase [Candidatus Gygaella obscura]
MNVRDSELICGLLEKNGFKLVDSNKAADIVLLNTCSVRKHAEDRVFSEVGANKTKIVGILGCMATNFKDDIFKISKHIDFTAGPNDIAKIPKILKSLGSHKQSFVSNKKRPESIYKNSFYSSKDHSYIVISEGCCNYCSYCIVPYVRGPLRNRSVDHILKEVKLCLKNKRTKITLLGQNVNQYKYGKVDFISLLDKISRISEIKELSFLTSHSKDIDIELFSLMKQRPNINEDLHLPIQSGSDKILKAMNRGYKRDYYIELAKKYKKIVNGALTTDIIVGFPGETEKDFLDTIDLMKKVKFNASFIFKYSPRPHTKASLLKDSVSLEVKKARHAQVLALQKKISKSLK